MLKIIEKARNFLSGAKTYLVSISAISGALVQFEAGAMTPIETGGAILGALGLSTLRASIAKLLTALSIK